MKLGVETTKPDVVQRLIDVVYVSFDPADPRLTGDGDITVLYDTPYFVCFTTNNWQRNWHWLDEYLVIYVKTREMSPADVPEQNTKLVSEIRTLKGIKIRNAPDLYTKYSCEQAKEAILEYVSTGSNPTVILRLKS